MKKILSLILALALCMAAIPAMAELGSDFTEDTVTVKIGDAAELPKVEIGEQARAGSSADTVNNSNGVYTIRTPRGLTIRFDPRGLTFMTLSQNYYASYDVYSLFQDTKTANNYINNMIAQSTHLVVWDTYDAFQYIYLDSLGGDDLTKHVKNMAYLSEGDINTVATALAKAVSVNSYSLYTFNGNVWVMLGACDLFTIANSEYVHVKYVPNGSSMTKADYSDFTDFMRSLAVY